MRLVVGSILNQDIKRATLWIEQGIAEEYTGPYPPKMVHKKPSTKMKINLKDLK